MRFCIDCERNGWIIGRDCRCEIVLDSDTTHVADDERLPAERDAAASVPCIKFAQKSSVASWCVARLPVRTPISETSMTDLPDEVADQEGPDRTVTAIVEDEEEEEAQVEPPWELSMTQMTLGTS